MRSTIMPAVWLRHASCVRYRVAHGCAWPVAIDQLHKHGHKKAEPSRDGAGADGAGPRADGAGCCS
jgi:hypothetical protein